MVYGMMGGYGYGASWMIGIWLLCLIGFAVGSFVFSAIFWLTYNWLSKEKMKKK